jgi:hypothetical protein
MPKKIYLCCGRRTGVGDGWIGFDIRPPADVLQDVRTIDGRRFRGQEALFMTPPCAGFTDLPWRPATGKDLDVLLACRRIADEAGIPWLLENNRWAQRYIGRAACHRSGHYFWGPLAELIPQFKIRKDRTSGRDPLGRARLPRVV